MNEASNDKGTFSSLSTGQKLSIKGQLFELGKKLAILDVENQQQSSYSFQPAILSSGYDLPNRHEDFISNVHKAEAIRKQKLQMLKSNLEREQRDGLTFSPVLNKSKWSRASISNEPVHERLSKKAVEYRQKHEELVTKSSGYDLTSGRKLFKPKLKPSPYVDLPSNITADEYLYRDAKDREVRMRLRLKSAAEEELEYASAKKINTNSELLIKRKAEREVRQVFDELDQHSTGSISYIDVKRSSDLLVKHGKISDGEQHKIADRVWDALAATNDSDDKNSISYKAFQRYFLPCAYRNASTMALTTPNDIPTSAADIETFNLSKKYFHDMVHVTASLLRPNDANQYNFQPRITQKSKILAKQKDSKDKDQILQLLAQEASGDPNEAADRSTELNNSSLSAALVSEKMSATDLMFARHLLTKQKLNSVRKQVLDERMGQCTFTPTINPRPQPIAASIDRRKSTRDYQPKSSSYGAQFGDDRFLEDDKSVMQSHDAPPPPPPPIASDQKTSKESVHERLYAMKDRQNSHKNIVYMSESLRNDLKECTFRPKIKRYRKGKASQSRSRDVISMPAETMPVSTKDFEKAVNRIKQARIERMKKQALLYENSSFNEESYQKSRMLAAQGPAPFHFLTSERKKQREEAEVRNKFRLYIDIKLGPARVGHLKIRDHDDPVALAGSFCRIYGLDDVACSIIAAATRESMIQHGIDIGENGYGLQDYEEVDGIDRDISSLQSFDSDSDGDTFSDSDDDYYSDEDGEESPAT